MMKDDEIYTGCSPKIDTNFKALLLESVNE